MKTQRLASIVLTVGALFVASASAAPLYEESFDYGNSSDNIQNVSNWDTGSGVLLYDHDGGLDHPQMHGETGGGFHHDHPDGNRDVDNPTDLSFDIFTGASAGDTWWMSALIEWDGTTPNRGDTTVMIDGDQTVNGLGFGVREDGTVFLQASDNGGTDSPIDTTATAVSGTTHLFLVKATFGAGSSGTRNSTIDFWFDPAGTSSEGALGSVTFSTGADSKFGRDGVFNVAKMITGAGTRVDEIRFGETLEDAVGVVPEPTSASAVLVIGGIMGLMRRRRR